MAVSCCGPLTGAAAKRSKHKEALVLLREQQNCEAPKKSKKRVGGKAPERRRPLRTPSDGNAANGLFW